MYRLLLLCLLTAAKIACQPAPSRISVQRSDIDSLHRYMDGPLDDLLRQRQYHLVGQLLDSLRPKLDSLDNVTLNLFWLNTKSVQLMGEGKYDSARPVLMEQMRYALEKDSSRKLYLVAEAQYANWLIDRDSLQAALRHLENAYYLAKKVDSTKVPKLCYSLMQIYLSVRDYAATRKYLQEGWRMSHLSGYDSTAHASAFACAYFAFYVQMEEFDSAIAFYNIAINDTVSHLQPYYKGVLDWNMGQLLLKKKQYELALTKYNSGFAAITKYDGPQAILYSTMASINDKLARYPTALLYADSAILIARQQRRWETVTNVWKLKGQIAVKLGDYREAYRAADSALANKQVLMDSSIAEKAQQIQTEYQVKAKDDRIQSLASLNTANEKISSQQRILIVSLSITFVLLAIIGVMWYRRRRLRNELRETALRQQLLRTQMEPHFIFNTLSVLQGYIYDNDIERATEYLSRFSKLLRLSLQNARQPFVSLDSEVAALEQYLSLQVMQADTPFFYAILLDPALEEKEVYIPPMLLQPFVENTIIHGFKELPEQGELRIRISLKEQLLHCVIEDNGKGLRSMAPDKGKGKPSYSTAITTERLQILSRQSGKPAVLTITERNEDAAHTGTRVEILIPYRLAPVKESLNVAGMGE
ncbi:histidine kinase [Chitinophaga filiformis]|uniref:Histidine kinase n=1 Tax=Chitinophaga filiformis TaxID=104663 RepID=A0ABY4I002_CHIFI|nr:histidine kinase [Chitinophaga filiformis]UPK68011.1 histidine kinase [Chitinophaga filiformis]